MRTHHRNLLVGSALGATLACVPKADQVEGGEESESSTTESDDTGHGSDTGSGATGTGDETGDEWPLCVPGEQMYSRIGFESATWEFDGGSESLGCETTGLTEDGMYALVGLELACQHPEKGAHEFTWWLGSTVHVQDRAEHLVGMTDLQLDLHVTYDEESQGEGYARLRDAQGQLLVAKTNGAVMQQDAGEWDGGTLYSPWPLEPFPPFVVRDGLCPDEPWNEYGVMVRRLGFDVTIGGETHLVLDGTLAAGLEGPDAAYDVHALNAEVFRDLCAADCREEEFAVLILHRE
jgi:hypothetical protein